MLGAFPTLGKVGVRRFQALENGGWRGFCSSVGGFSWYGAGEPMRALRSLVELFGGRFFAALACGLFPVLAGATPTQWVSRAWQTDDGLPNNDVTSLLQADDGAMLFGTLSGLARFDGLRLQTIRVEEKGAPVRGINGMCLGHDGTLWLINNGRLVALRPGQPQRSLALPALPADPRINTMLEQPRGVLWICFEEGQPLRLDLAAALATGKAVPQVLPGAGFKSVLAVDKSGEIWVAHPGALTRWTGKRFDTVCELSLERVTLCAARAGGLWLGAGRQLFKCDGQGLVEVARLPDGPPGNRASALLEDRQGRVWFGTFGDGLQVWDGKVFSRVEVSHHDVWSLREDREGNLWVGTGGGGVCRVRPRMVAPFDETADLVSQTTRSLCADVRGDIWLALQTDRLWRRHDGRWQALQERSDWPANNASCVAADPHGLCWIGTSDGGLVRWDGQRFESIPLPPTGEHQGRIRALLAARDGTVWIGRGNELVCGKAGVWQSFAKLASNSEVRVVAEDSRDNLWIGTRDGEILQVASNRLVRATPRELAGRGIIRTMLGTPDGALWIGTSVGLARLKDGQCSLITTAQGLRNNIISQLILGPNGRLWAASNRGLFFVALEELNAVAERRASTLQCIAFGAGEGVPGLQANSGYLPNVLRAPDGRLWFTTRNGIVIADPTCCGTNTNPPPVAIAELAINGQAVVLPSSNVVQVAPGAAKISFVISAMSYVAPENVRLQHLLAGADVEWQDTPADRTLVYQHLPPGAYTLRVRAANNDGVWCTQEAALPFVVQPFFYQRASLQLAGIGLGFVAVLLALYYAIMRRRIAHAHQEAEAALRASEEKYRQLVENSREIIYVVQNGLIQFANRTATQVMQRDLLNTSILDLVPAEDRAATLLHHEALLAGRQQAESQQEYRVLGPGGVVLWFAINAVRIEWHGQPATLNFGSDITERKQAAEALRESEQKFAFAFHNSPMAMALTALETGIYQDVNEVFLRDSGYTREEILGRNSRELGLFVDDQDRQRIVENIQQGKPVYGMPCTFRVKDGQLRHGLLSSNLISAAGRKFYLTIILDITEHQRAEEQNRHFNDVLRAMRDIGHLSHHEKDPQHLLQQACETLVQTRGYVTVWVGHPETAGQRVTMLAHAGQHGGFQKLAPITWDDTPAGHGPTGTAIRERRPVIIDDIATDPSFAPWRDPVVATGAASLASVPLLHGDQLFGVLTVKADHVRAFDAEEVRLLTSLAADLALALHSIESERQRQQAEAAMLRLGTAVEQSAESILITDAAGLIQYVNPAFERIAGYSLAEVVGQNPRLLKSDAHNADFYAQMWATLTRGAVWSGHLINRRKNGTLYEEDGTISPVRNAAGAVTNYVAIKRDVTNEVNLQQQLLQAQKMETVGQLAGGVAHDFNNILQTILGYCELLLKNTPASDERHLDLQEIQRSGERAATLTRQLLAFSRKQMLMPRVHDLNDIIANLSRMLTRVLGENVHLALELAPDLKRLKVDAGQMEQVLTNLAINARDAMPNGGQLSIRTLNTVLSEADLPLHPEGRVGPFACLCVSDNGTGMPREVRAHIFEPFFTTKEKGKGTGLGLSTVYGIIKQHDGWITVYSEPGQGTTFRLYLPVIEEAVPVATEHKTPDGESPMQGHGERILLIEDDPLVRRMTQQMLNHNGYRAIAVATCREAHAAFNSLIDLVLSDVMLPDGNGLDLVRQFQQQRPKLRCILTSGYADIHERWPEIEEHRWPFLIKPHNQADLLRALTTALAGASG